VKRSREDFQDQPCSGRPPSIDLTCRIQEVLDRNPFESARSIAEILHAHTLLCRNTCKKTLGFGASIYVGPHILTQELKKQRRRYACEMIPALEAAAKDGWHHIV
jgi:hypothetical protein